MKIRKCTKRIPKNIKTFILICVILAVPCVNLNAKDSLGGVIYWHCDSGQNKIALTFDDGPNNPYTKKVLDILNFYNIKATFFLIGKYVEDFPEITQRIIKEGHAIGNHTYNHLELRFETRQVITEEIKKCEEAILKTSGVKPFLYLTKKQIEALPLGPCQ